MKLFKRLMAGAMAIAMLSAYTVALAGTFDPSTVSGSKTATVSGAGRYAGDIDSVFVMTLPTAASVSDSLAFTVDPQRLLENSKPSNAISAASGGSDDFGTVVFSTQSAMGAGQPDMIYKNESEPLKVISKSSVDVTVNMLATLSDSKMKLFDGATFDVGSGFAADNKTDYLYLGVKVDTRSGATRTTIDSGGTDYVVVSGGDAVSSTKTVSPLGAREATVLKAVSQNFEATSAGFTTISGGPTLNDDSWNYVEYTVMGASNPNADWAIEGLTAPNLNIKWVIDPADKITYEIDDPSDSATPATYTAQLNKNAYQVGERVYVYVKPVSSTAKLKTVKFKYISVKATDGVTMDKETTVTATVLSTTDATGAVTPTVANGVYTAYFDLPNNMAKPNAPAGTTITTYAKPTFDITVS